jgi:YD repeat-containing protein
MGKYILCLLVGLGFMVNLELLQPNREGKSSGKAVAADISYIYDDVGQLRAVVDPAGETALYRFDDMGNLLEITRQSSNQVAILQFTPESGAEGTTVTIGGSGFSSETGQNTVAFNGTSAIVLSSTATKIVTTVPVSAMTGTLSVTTLAGSDSSSQIFSVHGNLAPTISGFSPTVGTAGTAVLVTGTNFQALVQDNKSQFNLTQSMVSASTATSLTTSVPQGAASGHITVTTPFGKTVSQEYFFIPPSPFAAADVSVTGRITIGETKTFTFSVPDSLGLIVFEGIAGQQVSWNLTQSPLEIDVAVFDPFGQEVIISATTLSSTFYFADTIKLPASGTYTLVLDTRNGTTGPTTITSYDVVDTMATIIPDGPAVIVTNSVPGQNARLTFTGNADQRVSVKVAEATFDSTQVYLENALGQRLAFPSSFAGSTGFVDVITLPTSGTYTIVVDPSGPNLGGATVNLYDVPSDITGFILPGGPSVTLNTIAPGQNASLTFSGTTGQRVSLSGINNGGSSDVSILNPDGSTLRITNLTFFLETVALPTNGIYTVFVNPGDLALLTEAVIILHEVPADLMGPIAINGANVPISLTTPGHNAELTFEGPANLEVTVTISSNTINSVWVRLQRMDGANLTAQFAGVGNFSLLPQTLPLTETYSIQIDPLGSATGTLSVILTSSDTIPPVVSLVTATNITGAGVNINWDTNESADSQVEYGMTTAYGSSSPIDFNFVTSHSIGLVGLTEATLYHYRVHSRDGAGNLTTSADHAFLTEAWDTFSPTAPTSLTAIPHETEPTIDLNWAAATDNVGVAGYEIERCQGSGCSSFMPVATVAGLTSNDIGLEVAASYSYRVRAIDAAGNLGPWSSTASATTASIADAIPPTAPPTLSGTGVSATQIDLIWEASTDNVGVTSYELWQCQGNGCTNFSPVSLVATLTFSHIELAKGTRYRYQVRATDAAGNWSGYSPIASIRTKSK